MCLATSCFWFVVFFSPDWQNWTELNWTEAFGFSSSAVRLKGVSFCLFTCQTRLLFSQKPRPFPLSKHSVDGLNSQVSPLGGLLHHVNWWCRQMCWLAGEVLCSCICSVRHLCPFPNWIWTWWSSGRSIRDQGTGRSRCYNTKMFKVEPSVWIAQKLGPYSSRLC